MKLNVFMTIICLALSVLLGYIAYTIAGNDENAGICFATSAICFAVSLMPAMGVKYDSSRIGINIRVLSIVFFILTLACNLAFAAISVVLPHYLIVNGLLLLIFVTAVYRLGSVRDV